LKRYFITIFCCIFFYTLIAQPVQPIIVKDVLANNRTTMHRNMVNNGITKNLSTPLSDSTEENWINAFTTIALIQYQSPWVNSKLQTCFKDFTIRGNSFKKAFLQLLFSNYPKQFFTEVQKICTLTLPDDIFALAVEYLYQANPAIAKDVQLLVQEKFKHSTNTLILSELQNRLSINQEKITIDEINMLLHQPFFKHAVVVYSFQSKNRNYPGIVIIRDSLGNFLKDITGLFVAIPQLARSITNLPFYCSNGNTPQGIFRMKGAAVSKINFIGPTPNIQLTMPCETSVQHFFNDSSITDSSWQLEKYNQLLPKSLHKYSCLQQTYFASLIGRTEIIAHGTTINPIYYHKQPYYPLTPTQGCLCCKEIWNEEDGTVLQSDQQKLYNAILQAGGTNGYLIVIDITDENRAINYNDIDGLLH
jgi:hypothetical protein